MNPAFVTVALIALMLPVAGLASPREELLRTTTGKPIDAVAISVTPTRYSDPAKVEKWFKRNCNDVLGRECTALEKGDWLSYMISQ